MPTVKLTSIFVTIFTYCMLVVNFFTVVLTSIRDAIFVTESYIVKSSSGILTRHKFGKKN